MHAMQEAVVTKGSTKHKRYACTMQHLWIKLLLPITLPMRSLCAKIFSGTDGNRSRELEQERKHNSTHTCTVTHTCHQCVYVFLARS